MLAAFLFVVAVVATRREAFWAYCLHASILIALTRIAQLPLPFVVRRLVFETPFVLFAVFLPVIGQGDRIDVLGTSLSVEGLWAAWNIFAKATLGLLTTIILAASTPVGEILHGLEHLRVPRILTAIAGFMIRYADVISGEMLRMKVAREARAYDPRWLWQARAVAASAGTLFIRSYERGERVYLAMLSRGFTGSLPATAHPRASREQWRASLVLPALATLLAGLSWTI